MLEGLKVGVFASYLLERVGRMMKHLIPSFLIVLLFLPGLAAAGITPFIVEDSGGAQLYPEVDGSVVVWREPGDGTNQVVRAKDIEAGNVVLAKQTALYTWAETAVTGSLIIWSDAREGDFDVYGIDLPTGQERIIAQALNNQIGAAAGDHFVVWTDDRNSRTDVPPEQFNSDIYAMNLRTGQEIPVCTAPGLQNDPDVHGDFIVWADQRRFVPSLAPYVSHISGYDGTTGEEILIAEDTGEVHHVKPAVSGDIVVWVDLTPAGNNIMGFNLSTRETFQIHEGGSDTPDIDGRYVVWSDTRNGADKDIWGYDLLTGEEFAIFLGPGNQKAPKISGNLVVWYTTIPGETPRVWAAYIPEPASVGLLAAGGAMLAVRRRRRSHEQR